MNIKEILIGIVLLILFINFFVFLKTEYELRDFKKSSKD
jgi:hypothetical protein